jgi:hypothetical protein
MSNEQSFIASGDGVWLKIDFLPGVELLPRTAGAGRVDSSRPIG